VVPNDYPGIGTPQKSPATSPDPHTIADPFLLPIGLPAPSPKPLPYDVVPHRQPNPGRISPERTESGYAAPSTRIGTGTVISTRPGLAPEVAPVPGADPALDTPPPTVVEIAPGLQPRPGNPARPPRPHRARKPRKREKEQKLVMGLTGKLAKVINFMTEGIDLVEVLHKSLPRKYQAKRNQVCPENDHLACYTRKPKPHEMAAAIYRNFDKMDWPKALGNVIKMEVGDRAAGKAGQMGAEANRRVHKATGVRIQINLGQAL
jgi:hypothetical protein